MTDLRVALSPAASWPSVGKVEPRGHWLSRYLLLIVVTGCAASLMTTGRVTLRIAVPCMLYATVVPLLQIGSLAVVRRGALPLRHAADLFAIGNTLWMLFLVVFASIWAWRPASELYDRFGFIKTCIAWFLLLWAAYIDYWFFRIILGRTPWVAARDLAMQRLLCWGVGLTLWVGPAGWQVIGSRLGL